MTKTLEQRLSSALLGTGAGLAVCLSGGGQAHAATGNIAASNGGYTNFGDGERPKAFAGQVSWILQYGSSQICTVINTSSHCTFTNGPLEFNNSVASINRNGYFARFHPAGVSVSAGMAGGFSGQVQILRSQSDKYLGVKFNAGGTKYGWIHVVSTSADGFRIRMDKWGYNTTGGSIRTLSPTLSGRSLELADGRVQLHWNSKAEEGVARYEVQQKNADGIWSRIGEENPGARHYTLIVPKGGEYRVLVEKSDGSLEEVRY